MRGSIFIDGNNFYHGLRYIYGKDESLKSFNFEAFCNFLAKGKDIISINYYNAELDKTKNKNKFNRR